MVQIEECKIREENDPSSVRRQWTNRADFEDLISVNEENDVKKKISHDMSSSTASLERRSDKAALNVQLSDFTIQTQLGRGSFGRVFLAKLGTKKYCIKVIRKDKLVDCDIISNALLEQ